MSKISSEQLEKNISKSEINEKELKQDIPKSQISKKEFEKNNNLELLDPESILTWVNIDLEDDETNSIRLEDRIDYICVYQNYFNITK